MLRGLEICIVFFLIAIGSGCAQRHQRGQSLFDKFHEDDLDRDAGKTHEMTVFEKAF